MMHAIEFEATAHEHKLDLPENISDGTHLRVLLLMDDQVSANKSLKNKPRKPSEQLKGSVIINDDLITPVSLAEDWDALK